MKIFLIISKWLVSFLLGGTFGFFLTGFVSNLTGASRDFTGLSSFIIWFPITVLFIFLIASLIDVFLSGEKKTIKTLVFNFLILLISAGVGVLAMVVYLKYFYSTSDISQIFLKMLGIPIFAFLFTFGLLHILIRGKKRV